ncbi:MAG: hypothetical protein AAGM22_16150 [Acidobacteriota bacterium]
MLSFFAVVAFAATLEAPLPPVEVADARNEVAGLQIQRLTDMAPSEELAYFLGPNRQVGEGGPRLRSARARLRSLAKDPAYEVYRTIDDRWLSCMAEDAERFPHLRAVIDAKLLIARSLYSRHQTPSRSSVAAAYERIRDLRRTFADLSIVEGRRVVFAASSDRLAKSGERAFGRAAVRRLLDQRASDFEVLGERGSRDAHRDLGAALATGASTFYFEGHGSSSRLDYRELHYKKLAKMLAARAEIAETPTVLVLAACRSHNFARNLYRELDRLAPQAPKPVLIVPEESGQDYLKDVFGSELLRVDLGVGVIGGGQLRFAFSNPRNGLSIFVPDRDNHATQIL